MTVLAAGLSWIDLRFLGHERTIATGVVSGPGGVALVDPGPSTCLESLEMGLHDAGLRLSNVTDLLLTHIHLDHAGAAGTIVSKHPHVRVHVHERGAPHVVDPGRLLESARRLYGDDMDRLWGDVMPVPPGNVSLAPVGASIAVGGREFEVAYTPGHASHHVSYFDRETRVAFVGDTAGVCINGGYVLPPTPPPDIDLELWTESVARIERWAPSTLFLTHFGPVNAVGPHLRTLMDNLAWAATQVRESLAETGTDLDRGRRFGDQLSSELRRTMNERDVAAYQLAAPPEILWMGLARYWRKKLREA